MMAPVRRHLVRRQKRPQIIQNLFHEKHVRYTARRHDALISGLVTNFTEWDTMAMRSRRCHDRTRQAR